MLTPAFLSAARDLIQADSISDHGNLAAVRVLAPLCEAAGLPVQILPAPDSADRDANLLAGPGGAPSGDPLLLVTHLDTVSPGPSDLWKSDPFTLTVEGNRAIGLGVADVKLDALCKLAAMERLKGVPLKRPFYFLGTYGEEIGLRGARSFAATMPFRPFGVLCGEPSELILCHAHKGYAVVRVRVRSVKGTAFAGSPVEVVAWQGKAAHSSTPALGVNAIDLALDELSKPGLPYAMALNGGASSNTIPARCEGVVYLRPACGPSLWKVEQQAPPAQNTWANVTTMLPLLLDLRALWRAVVAKQQPAEDARFTPAGAVANVTRIQTRKDAVELTMDARLLPSHDVEGLLQTFQSEATRLSTAEFEVNVDVDRRAGGLSLAVDDPFVREVGAALETVGLSAVPRAKPTSTEAGVFARAGIPALVFGASPSTGNAHTPNEFALLSQLERAIDAYEAVIRRLCG
jgi:acetylornithine deacetylase/succinyl-diaminopimelate desuccinylase-like protein